MELTQTTASPSLSAALPTLGDVALMRLVGEGDSAAFAVVYRRHIAAACALAFRMCGRRAAGEDVVQEAFLALWRSAARYDPMRGSVRTWLLGIVHHRAIDALRRGVIEDRGRISDEGIDEQLEAAEYTDREVGRREEARAIRAALGELPPDQSRVIELAYYGGLTHTEIAVLLDTPIGTVKGRMRLGLNKLRFCLWSDSALGDNAARGAGRLDRRWQPATATPPVRPRSPAPPAGGRSAPTA